MKEIISDVNEDVYQTYCLVIRKKQSDVIEIGQLGLFSFPEGIYVYTGSARSGLRARLLRHVSTDKTNHWHIDYLLENSEIGRIYVTDRRECEIGQALLDCESSSVVVETFGSSDCRCRSHLTHFLAIQDVPELDLVPVPNQHASNTGS